jgi:anti-sigma B factor antagonist
MATASRTYSSELSQLAAMRGFVGDTCRKAWATPADDASIRQLQLALCEAAANVIRHAYQGRAGQPIVLTLETRADRIRLTLHHDGLAFDPKTAAPPEFDGDREGGFGVYMMEQLADQVVYSREADGRSAVRLVKYRTPVREQNMALNVEKIGDVNVATLTVTQFDASYADQFKREITPALGGTRKLVLDLAAVEFIDSRACGAILSCLKRLHEVDGELKICQVQPFVREVFELIRLHRICEIVATRDEAVRAFSAGPGAGAAQGA